MQIRILGAHLSELPGARLPSILIDEHLVIDAGAITSSLSLPEQAKIRSLLLTHHHFDHTRDLVTLAANATNLWQGQFTVHALRDTLDVVSRYLLDGTMYTRFLEHPHRDCPSLILDAVEPYLAKVISGYNVLPVPVKHSVPTIGYQVTAQNGKSMFYTGDTTAGLVDCWQHVSPQLLLTELSGPNRDQERLRTAGHLCPEFLKEELVLFGRLKGYLPRVIIIHIANRSEQEIKEEVAGVARDLEADIGLGHEDMILTL